MASTPRIIIIDEDNPSRELLRLLIVAQWPDTQLSEVHDALSLARAMRSPVQDLCIVDPETSWADPAELLEMLCNDKAMGPVVVYSASDQAEPALRAVHAGATTYLVKDGHGPLRLVQELTRWLGPGRMQSDPKGANIQVLGHTIAMIAHDLTLDVDLNLHARARTVLGRLYSKTGDSELAVHHYSEALTAMSQEPDHRASVEIKMLLGEVMMDTGRPDEAMEYYLDALALAEANDHRMLLGEILARLGSSDPNRSSRMSHLQRALTVFREIGANDRMRDVQASVHRALLG